MKVTPMIWFDMDGTIADLYSVENWLPMLRAEDPTPYIEAKPLLRMCDLARRLNMLQKAGFKIGVISWTSKGGSDAYNEEVANAKREWLSKHLASVTFDKIDIVPYGTPKYEGRNGILFDDEKQNRLGWDTTPENLAFDVDNILEVLKNLL